MNRHNELSSAVPHLGRGRWVVGLVVAVFVVAAVIWTVASGFRGRHIARNAAAITEPLTAPVTAPLKAEAPRPAGEAPAH